MHQPPDDEMNSEQLRAELHLLKEQHKRLEEENEALNIRASGVQVLSKLLDQSRLEANELKRKLSEKTGDGKQWSIGSKDAVRRASSSGSLEKMGGLLPSVPSPSPWSTNDGDTLAAIMSELKSLLDKNKELTMEIEKTLRNQTKLNGDDGVLVEHLNRLKVELDTYQSRLQSHGDYPGKLRDEANRLKAKLTDIAVERGTKCGKLQDEIDLVKRKLQDIEERMNTKMQNDVDNDRMETEESQPIFIKDLEGASNEKAQDMLEVELKAGYSGGAKKRPIDETPSNMDTSTQAPTVKPRNDLKEEIERLRRTTDDLKCEKELLKSERDELIKVNHEWDAQYKKLQEYFRKELRGRDESFQKLQRELSQEHKNAHGSVKDLLDQKDTIIEEQAIKIRSMKEELDRVTLEGMQMFQKKLEIETEVKYQRAKKLLHEQKKENEILIKREETAMQEIQVLKDAVEVLERETKSLNGRNRWLEGEIDRLSGLLDQASERRARSPPSSVMFQNEPPFGRQLSRASEEQIEVLKQQVSIYIEDFNTEKQEKEKLAGDVKTLKTKLQEAQKETAECRRQMKIFENDYNKEREENTSRLRMRVYDPDEESYVRRLSPGRAEYQEEAAKRREYYQLAQEKSRITDRMSELERMRRPPDLYMNTGFNARGSNQALAASQQLPENPPDDMFFGGHVVRDTNGRDAEHKCKNCGECFGSALERFRHQIDCP